MANEKIRRSELRFAKEAAALKKNLEKRKKQQAELEKLKQQKEKANGQTEN